MAWPFVSFIEVACVLPKTLAARFPSFCSFFHNGLPTHLPQQIDEILADAEVYTPRTACLPTPSVGGGTRVVIGVIANEVVNRLLDGDSENGLVEASVSLPPRSTVWIATITGALPGQQIRRSTGTTDREQALATARKWEAVERKRRMELARQKPQPSPTRIQPGVLTQEEVAAVLRMSTRAVRNVEKRALRKLRGHPALRKIWAEFSGHIAEESEILVLTNEEVTALFGLARTPFELETLRKLLRDIPVR